MFIKTDLEPFILILCLVNYLLKFLELGEKNLIILPIFLILIIFLYFKIIDYFFHTVITFMSMGNTFQIV